MRAHFLISSGLCGGLMALSLGLNATPNVHSFDYASMYVNATASGVSYANFIPTATRSGAGIAGAANVLMLELYQPASGSASTWAYALGGAVSHADAVGSDGANNGMAAAYTNYNVASVTQNFSVYPGVMNESVSLSFTQGVTASSQACNVTFSAVLDANDQLKFSHISVIPAGWVAVNQNVYVPTGATTTHSSNFVSIASNTFNAITTVSSLASIPTNGVYTKLYSDTAGAGSTAGPTTTGAGALFNKCLAAYTTRAAAGISANLFGGGGGSGTLLRFW